jgi:2-polyprenyl-3-methyl-5-hydroxy-6-metoxy-1,4-benzoquinol methylase
MAFDPAAYWVQRHSQLSTSERAIEHLGRSEKQALEVSVQHQRVFATLLNLPAMTAWRDLAPRTALDLGAGIGRFSQPLREAGYDYLGVDISPVAAARARDAYPGVRMHVCDLREFRSDRNFDLIVCGYVLIHVVEDADWHEVLRNVATMLGPDGRFILIDDLDETTGRPAPHVTLRHRSDYDDALRTAGLRFNELTGEFRQLHRHYHLVSH